MFDRSAYRLSEKLVSSIASYIDDHYVEVWEESTYGGVKEYRQQSIRRRRECLSCQKRFTTYERLEILPIVVVKKDKSREVFDRTKLINGMIRACEKRPVNAESVANEIEAEKGSAVQDIILEEPAQKVIINGQLYIQKDGQIYTIVGQQL